MDNEEAKPKNLIQKAADWISRNPYFTLIVLLIALVADVASILGALFGIFPWWTAPKRDLSYCVYPIKIPIVQTTNTSDVSVSYKGQPVSGNVTAAEIAIWNAGRQPIRAEDILSPLIVTVANGVPLFETGLSQVSRDVTECSVNNHGAIDMMSGKRLGPSSVELKFRILEHNDGVRLRVVYAGTVDTSIKLEGTIIGQPNPHEVKAVRVRNASLLSRLNYALPALAMVICAIAIVAFTRRDLASGSMQHTRGEAIIKIVLTALMLASTLVIAAAALSQLYKVSATATPFGF